MVSTRRDDGRSTNEPTMDPEPTASQPSRTSVLAPWWPVVALGVLAAATAYGFSLLIGLNVAYTTVLLLLIGLVTFSLHLWRGRRDTAEGRPRLAPIVAELVIASVAVLGAAQLLPLGRTHSNAPVTGEPQWASPATRALVVRACYGCHSNEVDWPWYANVAPVSWAIADHVDEGRSAAQLLRVRSAAAGRARRGRGRAGGLDASRLLHEIRAPSRREPHRRGDPAADRWPQGDTRPRGLTRPAVVPCPAVGRSIEGRLRPGTVR